MPLIVTVNTIAECPRTDRSIYTGMDGGDRNTFACLPTCRDLVYECGTTGLDIRSSMSGHFGEKNISLSVRDRSTVSHPHRL